MTDDGWIPTVALEELASGTSTRVSLEGLTILLARDGDRVFAIANRCTHQGAPLDRGPVAVSGSLAMVTCPLHGSRFALESGKVLRGPATRPVAAYDVRVSDGVVEIRDRD